MSKIKTNRLEPRATNGSLTIGNPDSSTNFEGDVNIPQYATEEWVESIVTEDIALELSTYQKRDEKNVPNGYAGLDANGHIPSEDIPGLDEKVDKAGDTMTGGLNMSDNKIVNLATPVDPTDAVNKEYVDSSSPGGSFLPTAGGTMEGTITLNGPRDIDCMFGKNATLKYNGHDAFEWGNSINTSHQTLALTSPNRDIDAADGVAGHLSYAGTDKLQWGSNVTIQNANLDMDNNRIVDIGQPVENSDAATKYYVDNASESIDHPVEISVFPAVSGSESVFGVKNGGNLVFNILGDGDIDLKSGQIHNLAGPTNDNDAANKYYVDNAGKNMAGPVMIHSDYVGTDEVVFGVYEELSLAQAIEKGHDPATGTPKEPRDGVPYSEYGLFRVMGDGKLWGFNSLKGISAPPAANYDATNMEYVDSKVSGVTAALEARIAELETKISALESS